MNQHALMVISDEAGAFRWRIFAIDGEKAASQSESDRSFNTYESALQMGSVALAAIDEQPFQIEPAEPGVWGAPTEPVAKPADGRSSERGWPWAPEQSVPPS